ncbi:MAG: hypothetical protein QXU75_06040 [Candidatus Methanomethylicaceae archaeon]
MPLLDIGTLVNWLVSGFIGLIFGIGSAWVTYRYQRRRDDIAWEREKEKLREQFEHDKRMLEQQFQQRIKELEYQLSQQQSLRLREEILKGVDNPAKAIEELQRAEQMIYAPLPPPSPYLIPRAQLRFNWVAIVIIAIVILSLVICLIPILLHVLQR